MTQMQHPIDRLLATAEIGLRTVWGHHHARRPHPTPEASGQMPAVELSPAEQQLAGALMRVNHVGEVCAQALYNAQALATPDPALRAHFDAAAAEEVDHLAWTEQRLKELGSRPSLLNPLWYAGAFAIGLAAGRMGERTSLGFVIETERQVEQHLQSHLDRLPAQDSASRAIVTQMRDDEARHARDAESAGGVRPPAPVRWLMRAAAKVMTGTAHHI
ncbi:putative ubiquinone biosynthesis protein [Leptothrix cholodnii SP-6]|uniref:3-demethoxyubiquinol 3-hydroxylase n=1 Tax=Leptothrix cholodnii (strain ATCC 51168 / LMG 8142 / SP-6) TaxID=395495 RepID=B1Y316_LEPCP|nr:putative ubiquinone biosynthesis protein [Leptothrix cholodnii SP-6]